MMRSHRRGETYPRRESWRRRSRGIRRAATYKTTLWGSVTNTQRRRLKPSLRTPYWGRPTSISTRRLMQRVPDLVQLGKTIRLFKGSLRLHKGIISCQLKGRINQARPGRCRNPRKSPQMSTLRRPRDYMKLRNWLQAELDSLARLNLGIIISTKSLLKLWGFNVSVIYQALEVKTYLTL